MFDIRIVLINSITSFAIGYAFHHYQMAYIDSRVKECIKECGPKKGCENTSMCGLQQLVHLNHKLDELVGVVSQNCITEF